MGKRFDGSKIAYDLGNYIIRYDNLNYYGYGGTELGYNYISKFALFCGLEFEQFYMIVVFFIVSSIFYHAYRLKCNIHGLVFAYLVYFILCPMDQLRNQIAFSILLWIFPLKVESHKSMIKNVLIILLCSQFHMTFALYLLPIFLVRLNNQMIQKYFPWVIVGLTIVMMAVGNVSIIRNAIEIINSSNDYMAERYSKYSETQVSMSFLMPTFLYMLLVFSINKWKKEADIIYTPHNISQFCVYVGVFIPPLVVNATMYRLIRDITLVGILMFSTNSSRKNQVAYTVTIAIISLGWFLFDIVAKNYWIDYVEHFFINQIL